MTCVCVHQKHLKKICKSNFVHNAKIQNDPLPELLAVFFCTLKYACRVIMTTWFYYAFCFKKKFLADTHVLFWGHWYPCFGFLVASPLGFKAQVGSALFAFCGGECNLHSLRSTSGATLADLLVAITQLVLSPHTVAEVRLPGFELVLSEYLWARRSTNWAKPGPTRLFYSAFFLLQVYI